MGRLLTHDLRGQDKPLASLAVRTFQPRRHRVALPAVVANDGRDST